jgi:hypothetical protein
VADSGAIKSGRRIGPGQVGIVAVVLVLLVALAGVFVAKRGNGSSSSPPPATGPYSVTVRHEGDLQLATRVHGTTLQIATQAGYEDRFWPGVNLGSTTPGALPGEVRQGRGDYDRWLEGMGTIGVRVVRIYTILPPAFYEALDAYNTTHTAAPIRFIQGVWIPEDEFLTSHNLYESEVVERFREEIAHAVGAVHGDVTISPVRGHASGTYHTDVARWLLAWSPGIEWDPQATHDSDLKNTRQPAYHGTYITTRNRPTPTESWIAAQLDYLAGLEREHGWSQPLTFTNWLTTDPLEHPEEPLPNERLVTIDAMNLAATAQWPGGFFASYHAYPYYPEFLSLSKEYATYRLNGKVDPYAGYLHALAAHHDGQAVMVTEFGVPTGLGAAHRGPRGRDQGNHSEQQGMQIDADLLRDIHAEGFAGGVLFEWTDEWFKHTWNTMDYELPRERAQLWRNSFTNEEHFGVVASEASMADSLTIDGDSRDWTPENAKRVFAAKNGPIRTVDVRHDEEYLALLITTADDAAWRSDELVVGFDIVAGENSGLPTTKDQMPGADTAVVIGPGEQATAYRAAWLDPMAAQYGDAGGLGYLHVDPNALQPGSGVWQRPALMLNRPFVVPTTSEERGVETADVSQLLWGKSDHATATGDSRSLVDASGTVIELRLPWMLLGFADPSAHGVLVPNGSDFKSMKSDGVAIGVEANGRLVETSRYTWSQWDKVRYHERLKAGSDVLASAFRELAEARATR